MASVSWAHTRRLHKDQKPRKPLIFKGFPGRFCIKVERVLEPSCGVGNFFGMLPESMSESKLYGVELDSITGRIARQLYPNARIEVNGFEKTQYPDGIFDLAIGNVPFGNYRVSDRPYDRHNLLIHDYFFAKTIDKVRAGGIIAFITSNGISGGTMDKKDAHAREYMARRCDLLGAVRLPNTTRMKTAQCTPVSRLTLRRPAGSRLLYRRCGLHRMRPAITLMD